MTRPEINSINNDLRQMIADLRGFTDVSDTSDIFEARFPDTGEVIGYVILTKTCMECGQRGEIGVTKEEADLLLSGEHPGRALPNHSPAEWEQIHTGYHPACWDRAFPETED